MSEFFEIFLTVGFWTAAIRISTVFVLGAIGELITERSGVMNLGIEGIMTLGALVGFLVPFHGLPTWLGPPAALVVGVVSGFVLSIFIVRLGLNQHVTGIGFTLLAVGLAYYLYRLDAAEAITGGQFPTIDALDPLAIPGVVDIPWLGEILFRQSPLTYVAWLAVAGAAYFVFRTPAGLAIRTAGENPIGLEAAGLSVARVRTSALMIGSGISAVGGAYLTTSYFNAFLPGTVSGRGWIAVALVILAAWRPVRVLVAALAFGVVEAVAVRAQVVGVDAPEQVFLMLPYLAAIGALLLVGRSVKYPRYFLVPYRKNERSDID